MSAPLVSVIMNCYNGEQFLREAIDSIYAQTYQNWEIIFLDNASTDNSAQIAQSYDNRLQYFSTKRFTPLGEARELAANKAKGEFLAFLDCDDYWDCEKLSQQIPLFQESNVGLVYSNYWVKDSEREKMFSKTMRLPTGYVLDELLNNYLVGFLTAVVRREAVEKNTPFFNTKYNIIHDFDLMIRISVKWKFACVQYPLGCYRYHGDNETIKKLDQYINELEFWIEDNKSNFEISTQKHFYRRQDILTYMKGLESVKKREWMQALVYFYKLSFCIEKLKLFVVILLPQTLVRLFK